MNQIYLIRHGENQANITKEFSYKLVDYPLNEKGRLQAQQTAQFLQGETIHAIYTSPLKRCCQTAEFIGKALNLTPITSEAFRELNVGDLEKGPPTKESWDVLKFVVQSWMAGDHDATFPNGENYHQLWARYQQGLIEVVQAHPNQNVVVVGHGGIFTFTLKDLCPNLNLTGITAGENHNAAITRINLTIKDNHLFGTLIDWANTDHLSGKAAELTSPSPQHWDLNK